VNATGTTTVLGVCDCASGYRWSPGQYLCIKCPKNGCSPVSSQDNQDSGQPQPDAPSPGPSTGNIFNLIQNFNNGGDQPESPPSNPNIRT
jgi:hypothetical protein